MKKVFLAALCLSLPVFASSYESLPESEGEATPAEEEVLSSEESVVILPYCWDIDQRSCSRQGATQGCTDGIYSDYVCTCIRYTSYPYQTRLIWDCPEVR